jgi:hypothetical protein
MAKQEGAVDPQRLSIDQAAKMMATAFKRRIEAEKVRQDVEDGAPTNGDGTLNLVQYAAWLAKQMGRSDSP